jgi:flagellar basal-body rod modification protein FlgD
MIDHVSVYHPLRPLDSNTNGAAGTPGSSNSGPTTTLNNTLDANSFITLLTTELQAQDPTSPLDPTTLVTQLTDMNSLQELIQIRGDLDTLVSAASTASSGTPSGNIAGAGSTPGATFAGSEPSGATSSSSAAHAVAALKAQTSASLQKSLSTLPGVLGSAVSEAKGSASSHYAKSGFRSHIF